MVATLAPIKKMVGREGGMEKGKKVDGGIGEGEKKMVGG